MEVVFCMHHTIIFKYFKLLTNVLLSQVNTCIFFVPSNHEHVYRCKRPAIVSYKYTVSRKMHKIELLVLPFIWSNMYRFTCRLCSVINIIN
jgi:hypothetical protein